MRALVKYLKIAVGLSLLVVFFAGCKNHAPVITHNYDSDTIILNHGDLLDLKFSFIDDREELRSASVSFAGEQKYSGQDSIFEIKINTYELAAGRYIFKVNADDEDENITEFDVLLDLKAVKPTIGDLAISKVRATSAKVNFDILSKGGVPLKEKGIVFSNDGQPGEDDNRILIDNEETENTLEGFPRDTRLYVRAFASNSVGITMSDAMEIKTMNGIPAVRTNATDNIHSKSVEASGTLITDGGANLIRQGICLSIEPEPSVKDEIFRVNKWGTYNLTLDGLTQFTKYFYRAFAVNRFATVYGEIKEFETTGPPSVLTGDVGRIMVSSINMNIDVTDDGGHEVTETGIVYSMLKTPTLDTNVSPFGKGTGPFSGLVESLDSGAKYHMRAYALNSEGVSYGEEIVLFTKLGIPEVHTVGVSDVDYSSAKISGNIPDDGGLDLIETGVVWDTIMNPTKANNFAIVPGNNILFDFTITGLKSGQKYYARAYARNERGYVYASPVEFVPYLKTDIVEVKGGTFSMGNDRGDKSEKPVHQVTIDPFQIGKYEVSNAEFAAFLNYHVDEVEFEGENEIVILKGFPVYVLKVYGEDYEQAGFDVHISYMDNKFVVCEECGDFPAILVSWEGARLFCEWAGGRLPTESEWEFAAKGGRNSGNEFPGGNNLDVLGWYSRNSKDAGGVLTSDGKGINMRGLKRPNSLGLYDMSGNASEWCLDVYSQTYYKESSSENPRGPEKGIYRVIRGGSWADRENECKVSTRIKSFDINRGYDNVSFRIVRPVAKTNIE